MSSSSAVVKNVYRKLGGQQVLHERVASEGDLARVVHRRIPLKALASIRRHGLSEAEIDHFIIAARTRRHRQMRNEPLTVEESDRLVRIARIQSLAENVFEDEAKANRWLRERLGVLNGQSPLEVSRTEAGARLVEQILAKIDWGAAA